MLSRLSCTDVEPEDFVLDELASIFHHSPPSRSLNLNPDRADSALKPSNGRPAPFAFTPSDPRYYGREAPPVLYHDYAHVNLLKEAALKGTSVPDAGQSAKRLPIHTRGQKENVNYVENDADTQPEFVNILPIPVKETPIAQAPTTAAAKSEVDTDTLPVQASNPLDSVSVQEPSDESDAARVHHYNRNVLDGPVAQARLQPLRSEFRDNSLADIYFTALVAGCTAVVVAGIIGVGVCLYSHIFPFVYYPFYEFMHVKSFDESPTNRSRLQKGAKAAAEVEYPAYGVTGPGPGPDTTRPHVSTVTSPKGHTGSSSAVAKAVGDRKLAQSAHMFHYQHQKQQVIAMERHAQSGRHGSASGGESEEETEEGDYTVYECPGLAPTGEMEVKNPLFLDDPTPASPPSLRHHDH
nr:EOG090X0B4J [Lepidurus arcticus]